MAKGSLGDVDAGGGVVDLPTSAEIFSAADTMGSVTGGAAEGVV
jgi:hypothetical protein